MLSGTRALRNGARVSLQWRRTFCAASDYVRIEYDEVEGQRSGVAWLRLNRPSKLNAMTEEMGEQFKKAIQTLNESEEVRSVIITGEGKAFSAGGDVDFLWARQQSSLEENQTIMKNFYSRYLTLRDLKVPVIAAINGPAVGAGMCVAMACDLRVASKTCKMGVNFAKLGIHPGLAATYFLPKVAGPQVAAYMLMTGSLVSGEKAQELGLVLEAVEPEQVLPRSLEIARDMAAASPIAVRAITETLRGQTPDLEAAIDREAFAQVCGLHFFLSTDRSPDLRTPTISGERAVQQPISKQYFHAPW